MADRLSSPKSTSVTANTDDAQTQNPASPAVAPTAIHGTHQDVPPAGPPAGNHGWYSVPAPYPPNYHWPPQPHVLVPLTAPPIHPSWNNYHLAAHATQSAVPVPPMFSPPPLQHTMIMNPYANPPIDYATSPAYQVPQVYHGGFHPASPPHPVTSHGQLTSYSQPTPASQFQGPTHPPYLYHPVGPGAQQAFRIALSTASPGEASMPQCGSGTPTGRQAERLKRTKQTPFAMWVGNIDSTITIQELYEFFRQIDRADLQSPEESAVVSIFLIPKSNCAFVNFRTEAVLKEGIVRFHGAHIRPDPGTPRLACRKRTADHCDLDGEWDEEGDEKGMQEDEKVPQTPPNSRYFIMKSLTHISLQDSVQSGMWATQLHNEVPLDQAYHSCEAVYLIFGANKSGEFFGYARMNGPIFDEASSSNTAAPPVETDGSTGPGPEERRWGKTFPIEWIRTTPLSFKRTQHLLDPWNHNREVKISTDGQEIAPSTGRKLLALWH